MSVNSKSTERSSGGVTTTDNIDADEIVADDVYSLLDAVDSESITQEYDIGKHSPKHDFENHVKVAIREGFDPDDLPSRSTFKPSRLNNRFEELEQTISVATKEIRSLAAERGAPIGNTLRVDFDDEEGEEPSKRTIDRMLRRNGRKVLEEVEKTVFPSFSLSRSEDVIYDDDELLFLETIAAINNSAANQGGEQLSDLINPEPEIDDPFYSDGPTGETLLESIKDLSVDELAQLFNSALKKTYLRAKPKLDELDNFDTNVMVALDITYMAYWGEEDGIEWLQGVPKEKEYKKCFKFATPLSSDKIATTLSRFCRWVVLSTPTATHISEKMNRPTILGMSHASYSILRATM